MGKPSVLVLYNKPVLPTDHPDAESEHSVVEVADRIVAILADEGFGVRRLALGADPADLWSELKEHRPDAVFNLFEGNPDNAETESFVAGLLDWSGVPYTGSPFATLALARAKHMTNYLLRGAGLPTADFQVVSGLPMPACSLAYPVIVKPANLDASVGVDQGSVCVNANQMERRVQYLLETYGPPVLVEAFIDGREFNVPVLELPSLQALTPTEIVFPNRDPNAWSIMTYDGKWNPESPDYDGNPPTLADYLPPALQRDLSSLALDAYRLLGCRDYARVDFRMNAAGKLHVLEVNPNPEISDGAGFSGSLCTAPLTYVEFVVKLARQALSRARPANSPFTPCDVKT